MHLTATESKFRRHSGARIWDRGGSGFSVWAVFFRQGRARILQTAVFFFLIFFRQNLIFRGWLKVRKGRALTLQTAFFLHCFRSRLAWLLHMLAGERRERSLPTPHPKGLKKAPLGEVQKRDTCQPEPLGRYACRASGCAPARACITAHIAA